MSNKHNLIVLIIFIGFIAIAEFTVVFYLEERLIDLKEQAIKAGAAEHNPISGEWQWKDLSDAK